MISDLNVIPEKKYIRADVDILKTICRGCGKKINKNNAKKNNAKKILFFYCRQCRNKF